jgi:hypothetical protein
MLLELLSKAEGRRAASAAPGRRALAIHTFILASRLAQSFIVDEHARQSCEGSAGAEGSDGRGGWPNQRELAISVLRESKAGSACRERMHCLPLTRARQVCSPMRKGSATRKARSVTEDRARAREFTSRLG